MFMNYFYGLFYSCVDYLYKPLYGKYGSINLIFSLVLIVLYILLLANTFFILKEVMSIMFLDTKSKQLKKISASHKGKYN